MNYSRQREEILNVLRSTVSHPTAQWIYDETKKLLPNISLGTVYRNLQLLVDSGDIIKVQGAFDKDRYDGNAVPHCHLVCTSCGSVEDYELDTEISSSLDAFCKREQCVRYELSIFSKCSKCDKDTICVINKK